MEEDECLSYSLTVTHDAGGVSFEFDGMDLDSGSRPMVATVLREIADTLESPSRVALVH